MKGNLTIDIEVTEQQVLESCLNYAHQGCKEYSVFILAFYAIQEGLKANWLFYYLKEMGLNGGFV